MSCQFLHLIMLQTVNCLFRSTLIICCSLLLNCNLIFDASILSVWQKTYFWLNVQISEGLKNHFSQKESKSVLIKNDRVFLDQLYFASGLVSHKFVLAVGELYE